MVLRLRISPPPGPWRNAKCKNIQATVEYDPFFEDDMDEAISFCNGDADGFVCPIRHECLVFALANNHKDGIWGGCSELTRKAMRRRWPLTGKTPRSEWHWMSEKDAMCGVRLADLYAENDDDDDGYFAEVAEKRTISVC